MYLSTESLYCNTIKLTLLVVGVIVSRVSGDKGQIDALLTKSPTKTSYQQIADAINRSKTAVAKYIRRKNKKSLIGEEVGRKS